jgi:hypothetical protein
MKSLETHARLQALRRANGQGGEFTILLPPKGRMS